jgi:hypothetical protein
MIFLMNVTKLNSVLHNFVLSVDIKISVYSHHCSIVTSKDFRFSVDQYLTSVD